MLYSAIFAMLLASVAAAPHKPTTDADPLLAAPHKPTKHVDLLARTMAAPRPTEVKAMSDDPLCTPLELTDDDVKAYTGWWQDASKTRWSSLCNMCLTIGAVGTYDEELGRTLTKSDCHDKTEAAKMEFEAERRHEWGKEWMPCADNSTCNDGCCKAMWCMPEFNIPCSHYCQKAQVCAA
jgi:hypothetical protein